MNTIIKLLGWFFILLSIEIGLGEKLPLTETIFAAFLIGGCILLSNGGQRW